MRTRTVDFYEESTYDMFVWKVISKREEINALDKQIQELTEKRRDLVKDAVHLCNHPLDKIYELPYNPNKNSMLLNPEPEWLICKKCGLTEPGWGIGHVALRHAAYEDLPKISKYKWNEWRTVTIHEEDKCKWKDKTMKLLERRIYET
jgi:hypothetical protein